MDCQNCKFYDLLGKEEGFCRRYPSAIAGRSNGSLYEGSGEIDSYTTTQFPIVNNDDWCGEFKDIPK